LKGEFMSATKQRQPLARETSLLAQIRVNAEWIELDAAAKAREMFGCEFEQITVDQAWAILRVFGPLMEAKREAIRAARTPISGPHSHECITCGEPVDCYKGNCREVASEHRYCHEGYSASEWVIYHRKLGERY
jgi:hypothetical protein